MAVKMPYGKKFAVCFTFDVDITSLWLGCFKFHTMNPLSRGEFGVRYGLGRILNLLDEILQSCAIAERERNIEAQNLA